MQDVVERPDLDRAIEQLINLGERDPQSLTDKLLKQHDEEWVREELYLRREDFITDLARTRMRAIARADELALIPNDPVKSSELQIKRFWIPNEGWKRGSDLTPGDLDARAAWYENFAKASLRRAQWLRNVAQKLRDAGAETLGDYKEPLPPLPADDELELPAELAQ